MNEVLSDVSGAKKKFISFGSPLVVLLATVAATPLALLGHIATTCTMGADGSWFAGMIFSLPFYALQWWMLIRMLRREWSESAAYAAFICLPLAVLISVPLISYSYTAFSNVFFKGGSLCGPDYVFYVHKSDIYYLISRELVALYYPITLILSFGLIAKVLSKLRPAVPSGAL